MEDIPVLLASLARNVCSNNTNIYFILTIPNSGLWGQWTFTSFYEDSASSSLDT